ncbi:MAG: TonB family protein [bacterium]
MFGDRSFRISLLISFIFHLAMLIYIPITQRQRAPIRFVEVSLVSLPAIRPSEPGYPKSPALAKHRTQVSPAPGVDIWTPGEGEPLAIPGPETKITLTEVLAPEPELGEKISMLPGEDRFTLEGVKISPGLPDKGGIFVGKGEARDFAITGPVSRRGIVRRVYPQYPRWAEEAGVSGEVRLKFWVLPDGLVNRVEVTQTAGYPDLDQIASQAMKKWLFESLSPQEKQIVQWGTITLRFKLE